MNIIGFSSGVVDRNSNVDRMVKAILSQSGGNTEFVKLTDLTYSGCKGCVRLCARHEECGLEDDLLPYYHKIKEADAVVLGSPIYFSHVNTTMLSFIERFFGYRHVNFAIRDKPFVLVVCGEGLQDNVTTNAIEWLRRRLKTFRVAVIDTIEFVSKSPPCLSCGRHHECCIGALYYDLGESAHKLKIASDLFHRWEDDLRVVQDIEIAALKLKNL